MLRPTEPRASPRVAPFTPLRDVPVAPVRPEVAPRPPRVELRPAMPERPLRDRDADELGASLRPPVPPELRPEIRPEFVPDLEPERVRPPELGARRRPRLLVP